MEWNRQNERESTRRRWISYVCSQTLTVKLWNILSCRWFWCVMWLAYNWFHCSRGVALEINIITWKCIVCAKCFRKYPQIPFDIRICEYSCTCAGFTATDTWESVSLTVCFNAFRYIFRMICVHDAVWMENTVRIFITNATWKWQFWWLYYRCNKINVTKTAEADSESMETETETLTPHIAFHSFLFSVLILLILDSLLVYRLLKCRRFFVSLPLYLSFSLCLQFGSGSFGNKFTSPRYGNHCSFYDHHHWIDFRHFSRPSQLIHHIIRRHNIEWWIKWIAHCESGYNVHILAFSRLPVVPH